MSGGPGVQPQERLREAEERYGNLVEQLPTVVYVAPFGTDPWLYVSPQIEQLLGFTQEEWLTTPELWYRRLHPDDRDRVMAEERYISKGGDPYLFEYRMLAKDGRVVWVHDDCRVFRDGEDNALLGGTLVDVTALKQTEEWLLHAYEREREAGKQLRELDELKTTFLNAVSHELRTPLSAVLGFALTLEREPDLDPGRRAEVVERLAANARKLERLLADLLDMDRLSRGVLELRRAPADVGALVERVVAESDATAGRTVEVEVEPVTAVVDAAKVERMVENLVVNAVRHTPAGSPVWVRVSPERDGVLIRVDDAGPGVSPERREAIFEPFARGSNTPEHMPGVGIGLSLVARFAELHGGKAWVEDRPGGGSSFRVLLPGGETGTRD